MAPETGVSFRAPYRPSSILLILLFFSCIFTSRVASLLRYDRDTLLDIRHSTITHVNPEFFHWDPLLTRTGEFKPTIPPSRRKRRRRKGRRAGVLVRLRRRPNRPPLPSILLANVQSLDNKLCELRARISFQRDIRDCNIICFTETWLSGDIPDHAITPAGFSVFRADRSKELSGKSKGGGVCFMVNNLWCDPRSIHSLKSFCSPDLEYLSLLCRPFWLPREFTAVIVVAVYIPPLADRDLALKELYGTISNTENMHPEAAFIVVGDFNQASLRKVLPKYFQHINVNTRGDNILDHCYSPFRNAFKPLLRAPFGKSDHSSILLLPAYRQKLKQTPPSVRTIHCWSEESDAILQDCFDHTDWGMFRDAANNDIDEYTEAVNGFILKCIADVVPTKTVRVFPNRKPWINSPVRAALKARDTAFASGDIAERKKTRYDLRRAIKAAKREYGERIETQMSGNDPRSLWQGLRTITDLKERPSCAVNVAASLPDELNSFFARFETNTILPEGPPASTETTDTLVIAEADVRKSFRRVNTRKAAGPDEIPGRVIRACAVQLAGVFTDIFNLSLSQCVVPSCFKSAIIVPVPKKSKVTCLNDWRPVALTSIVSKCFEKHVRELICSMLPPTLDPHQFAYRQNRSTDDAIAITLHTALTHLEKRNTYVRMLFVDYSSAFNTIVPPRLDTKLRDLGLNPSLCSWILDFLSGRRQVVKMGSITSAPLTLNTGAPQGCVLSPLLYSLYTHDCVATHSSNLVIKFADDTTVIGLITDNDETAYRREVNNLTQWCQENNLSLNVDKTKELIVDYRKRGGRLDPIAINGSAVERVSSFKFLGVHITEDLTWDEHTGHVVRKAQQRLFHLRRLKKFGMGPKILRAFYRGTTESILTGCITAWHGNCTALNRKALQRVVRTAQSISGCELPSIQDIYNGRCVSKARRIIKDPCHPNHGLFQLLPSGKRYRSLKARTSRLRDSFFHQATRLMNNGH